MSGTIVREAQYSDADAGAALIQASIRLLCAADHRDDSAQIAAWLANKTPAEFRRWLAKPGQCLLVAEREKRLAGVGLMTDSGELLLLYVHPASQGLGAGAALLTALEQRALARGASQIMLDSTKTALGFYLRRGYAPTGIGELSLQKPLPEIAHEAF